MLLEKGKVPAIYKELHYTFNQTLFYSSNSKNNNPNPGTTNCIAFPSFLTPKFTNPNEYRIKKIKQKYLDGFGIIINDDIKEINQYLAQHFNKNSRSPILKKMRRLENCFNISYKIFYGHITKETYDNIMQITHAMLVRRFEQKSDSNFILDNWQKYYHQFFPLINKKMASLFVIYSNQEPIQISINYHHKKTFFAYIPAYNIDFSQFGLGNIAVYKQLEWCIKNGYNYLDMGNGDYDYKVRWCNYNYSTETHIYYNKKLGLAQLQANILFRKIQIINILKDIKHSNILSSVSSKKYENKRPYTIKNIDSSTLTLNKLTKLDIFDNIAHTSIKKPIYDFLYKQQDHINNISVYQMDNEKNTFVIKGKTETIKVIIP
ncbi:MAG: GNAT family N-acetyltransferase [Aestuariibaculum sp.]